MEISDSLLCLFHAQVEERDDSYVIEVPEREVTTGTVESDEIHRVAVLPSQARDTSTDSTESTPDRSGLSQQRGQDPPVEEGEVLDVEIEDVGDQGDGIARVGPGYVIIIDDTELGERVSIEITNVRENMAFADVVERYDRPR